MAEDLAPVRRSTFDLTSANQADSPVPGVAAPPRHTSWYGTSWLMLTDIVGTSVLTFAGVAAKLGWVLTIGLIILMCPVAVYTAMLMSRTRQMLSKTIDVEPLTMGECARHTLGGERAAKIVYFLVYFLSAFFGNASYLLTLGDAFQGVFGCDGGLCTYDYCDWEAVFISCVCVLPVVIYVRHLSDSILLCFLNLFLIIAVLAIVVVKLISDGRGPEVETFMIAEGLTVLGVFTAMTNILYAYTGHWLYFELMAEMEKPDEFPRVFLINAPLQTVLYLTVAIVGYYYAGSDAKGFFLDNITGTPYQIASGLLFVHVCIAFLIKNVVLARFLHGMVSPARVEEASWRARGEYVACGISLLIAGFFVSNAIPFFSDFLGLVGGLLSGPISFFLPMAFFYGARKIYLAQGASLLTPEGQNRAASAQDTAKNEPVIAPIDIMAMVFVAALTTLTMVVGSYGNISSIIDHASTYGRPFSCHPTRLVDTTTFAP